MSFNEWLAIWGAFLSTILAVVKIYEVWKSRDRLDASFVVTSDEDYGNLLQIRNLSEKPILIEHWEIFAARDKKGRNDYISIECGDFDTKDVAISPHSSVQWIFSEGNYFSTSENFLQGRSIYLKLWIVGRKPYCKKLYPFDD